METRAQIVSVAAVALLFAPVLKADPDSQVPMTLRAPVTFGLWNEQAEKELGEKRYVMKREAPRPGRLGTFILYDAPGPGYFRQLDQFDALSLELLEH